MIVLGLMMLVVWASIASAYWDSSAIDPIFLRIGSIALVVTIVCCVIVIGRWSQFDEFHPWVNAALLTGWLWVFARLSRPLLTAPMQFLTIVFLLYWTIVISDRRVFVRFVDPNGYVWMEMAAQIMAYWLVTGAALALVNFTSGEWRARRAALSSPHIGRGR